MNTAFMLMAQYNGLAIIPIDQVCTDYFTHLTPDMFQRKVLAGQIQLPITRLCLLYTSDAADDVYQV